MSLFLKTRSPKQRWLVRVLLLVLALLLILVLWSVNTLRSSLPVLDGDVWVQGVDDPVIVERDYYGVPTITGNNRTDVAFATGYLHAQERFFQMDLGRRNSDGELSELVGSIALEHDKKQRKHRFRLVAQQAAQLLSEKHQNILNAYTRGVNAGLTDLGSKPFEYWLLNVKPQPWLNEDTFLTVFSMYLDLNDGDAHLDNTKGYLEQVASREVIEFLSPLPTRWDSPLVEDNLLAPALPASDQVNLRSKPLMTYKHLTGERFEDAVLGSNNWAVSGALTSHGGALVENDMHLNHRVPNVWYRAQFRYPHPEDSLKEVKITGVSLPGTPIIVVGSNGSVAWSFTNSYGDWVDLISLDMEGNVYQTPEGNESLYQWSETIAVKGQKPVTVDYQATRWGPVVESLFGNTSYALRWTAHNPNATNLNLIELESATTVEQAMTIANASGIPPQNFTAGDSKGNIGWTIAGRMPSKLELDSTYPVPWAQADAQWSRWLTPEEYPAVMNPESNRIWTANARVASGENLKKLGNGGYAPGPRQLQIRNALMGLDQANEAAMMTIALDHRAIYMSEWRNLAMKTLTESARAGNRSRQSFYQYLSEWSGKAGVDDVGYRLARELNDSVMLKIQQSLGRYFYSLSGQTLPESTASDYDDGWMQKLNHDEEMIWRLLDERPLHWLSPKYESWDDLLLESIDDVIRDLGGETALARATWGQRNTAKINHPLSSAIPVIGQWLNMPAVPLTGDLWMPKAQQLSSGVSERIIVAPGREEDGIFHMPGGQSGHPLSPFYNRGYMDWVKGDKTPFLPQKTLHTLTLQPR
ncbi:hypothetical protein GZ77_17295 [Endozoicomonas montiporae]|uniref:Penicillin amidase n=2 Tax=Endozoicomonas montiporae TaxID=1027273 RepID=A0A081N1J2_9GAMM|nr:penicillin acylase family protein [Endozoicomonas montiporae]KEQ12315.1 hypothetical protein GZ77_17295 [Endozoicomonas montiporae]